MTIAPIERTVTVKAPPERAFAAFTGDIARWWPKGHTIAAKPHVAIVLEPRVGGRWFERDEDGSETNWGKVLAWSPPGRLVLAWQINSAWKYDPALVTEVELTFAGTSDGATKVTLTHRNLERFGDSAQAMADQLGGGWGGLLQGFADFAHLTPASSST